MLILTAFRNLFRNVRRSLAIILTISLGTGALYCFDGFNEGIMNQYRDNTIHSQYGHGQINEIGYREQVYEKPWDHWIENSEEVENYLKKLKGIDYVFPRVTFFALLTNGNRTISGMGQGVSTEEEAEFFYTLNIEEGEMLIDQPDGILLGKGLAHSLDLHPGNNITILANTIDGTINGIDLNVTGIFHTGSQEFDNRVFRIPLGVAKELLDTEKVENIALGLNSLDDWGGIKEEVEQQFSNLEATPFSILDRVYYQHSVDWLNAQFSVIQVIILTIVLLGILNSISTAILERKQEIGNLRANGESRLDIMKLLIAEGFTLGLIGSILGILLSLLLNMTILKHGILMPPAPGLTLQFHVPIELQQKTAIFSCLLGLMTALFATIVAGIRMVKIPIGEALRAI